MRDDLFSRIQFLLSDKQCLVGMTVGEQEFLLNHYDQNQQFVVKADAYNLVSGAFKQKIEFKGIVKLEDTRESAFEYRIEHLKNFPYSDSSDTTKVLSMDSMKPWLVTYTWFYIHSDNRTGKVNWEVKIGNQRACSDSSTPNNLVYYQKANEYLTSIKAQIDKLLPGALDLAVAYPIHGPAPIDLVLNSDSLIKI